MSEQERRVTVVNRMGLHARPAAEFVKIASKFASEITVSRDTMEVNGKSILGVMTLAAECGSELLLRARGEDAEAAIDALADVLGREFGDQ
ncbi:MAG: HPr family phosphocarrier protein [Gemmatimonadota bacterium]|nr:MAG: HPr family phosphocarrier protein [Gemmatimonadota bacterium]